MFHKLQYTFFFFCLSVFLIFSGCSSPPITQSSKIVYMEIFIPSRFVADENIEDREFNVYINGKLYGQGLKPDKSTFGSLYTLLNPYRGTSPGRNTMSNTSIPFPEGWHEIILTMKEQGRKVYLPLRLMGKKSGRYKDEPNETKISKMFIAGDGPGPQGQYFAQFSLNASATPPITEALKKERQEKEKTFGSLSLASDPQTEVYLDGDFVGMTPIEKLKIREGKHILELRQKGYKSWKKDIRIISETHVPLEVILEKETYIDEKWKVD